MYVMYKKENDVLKESLSLAMTVILHFYMYVCSMVLSNGHNDVLFELIWHGYCTCVLYLYGLLGLSQL